METWEVVPRKSVDDKNVIPGTWYYKCKNKLDWNIKKLKVTIFCDRGCPEENVA